MKKTIFVVALFLFVGIADAGHMPGHVRTTLDLTERTFQTTTDRRRMEIRTTICPIRGILTRTLVKLLLEIPIRI